MYQQPSRAEKLNQCRVDVFLDAARKLPIEMFRDAGKQCGISAHKLQKAFLKHGEEKTRKEMDIVLKNLELPAMFDAIDVAEIEAADRREQLRLGDVEPEDQPAHFDQFSVQELVDIRLRPQRRQWISQLEAKLAASERRRKLLSERVMNETDDIMRRKRSLDAKIAQFNELTSRIDPQEVIAMVKSKRESIVKIEK